MRRLFIEMGLVFFVFMSLVSVGYDFEVGLTLEGVPIPGAA